MLERKLINKSTAGEPLTLEQAEHNQMRKHVITLKAKKRGTTKREGM